MTNLNALPDCFKHVPNWISKEIADIYIKLLIDETASACKGQMTYGPDGPRFNPEKRMGRFGDANITYTYKDKKKPVHAWTPTLLKIKQRLNDEGILDANCVVVNMYGDRTANLYPHTDITYIPELGQEPTIISISFGATRDFALVPIENKGYKDAIMLPLSHGDMFVMSGRSQLDFKHGMPAADHDVGLRLSLTFRRHNV